MFFRHLTTHYRWRFVVYFVWIRPAQIQQCQMSKTPHRQYHLLLHRHNRYCSCKSVSICFVFFIAQLYQLLTLYSVEYDSWTLMWTRFVRHEVLSAVFWVFKFFLLYCFNCLVNKPTDVSEKHDASILRVNQPEIIWFVLRRECGVTTLPHFGESA